MGNCQTDCRAKQEIDPYDIPIEKEPLKMDEVQSEEQIIKIQSIARGYKAKQEAKELREYLDSNKPLDTFAKPYEGPMKSDRLQVQKILEVKYVWPARSDFKGLIKLPAHIILATQAIYKGSWKDGKRHGKGIQFWPDGSVYEGDWVNDKADGYGRLIHPDGDYYQGQWVKDKAQGQGVFTHVDGNTYSGEWFQDKQHGKGIEKQADFVYEGYFQNGFKHGAGKITWVKDGSFYVGDFYEGLMQGIGRFVFEKGKEHQGSWFASKMHGHGELVYPNGKRYIGNFEQGMKNGYGRMEYPDGKIYAGGWKNGQQHGEGTVTTKDGRSGNGIWNEGKRITQNEQQISNVQNAPLN